MTRVPVPLEGTVDHDVDDDFEGMEPGGLVTNWNVYTGVWNPVAVVKDAGNRVLRLEDQDPWDYATATRVFPETTKARVSLDVRLEQAGHDNLEIEIQSARGERPVRIILVGKDGVIVAHEGTKPDGVAPLAVGSWVHLDIDVDTITGAYDLSVDGSRVVEAAAFAEPLDNEASPYESGFEAPTVERVTFRTGIYRGQDFSRYGWHANGFKKYEPDLPGADEPVSRTVIDLDNVKTETARP